MTVKAPSWQEKKILHSDTPSDSSNGDKRNREELVYNALRKGGLALPYRVQVLRDRTPHNLPRSRAQKPSFNR